jgi:hypothetical protein
MIIGYSILYIDDDIGVEDILWERRVVYSNWDDALKKSKEVAEKEKNRRGEDSYLVSLLKSDSKKTCESNHRALVYKVNHKKLEMIGEVFIIPVFNE